jgi:small multidrug resistance family-3 protein
MLNHGADAENNGRTAAAATEALGIPNNNEGATTSVTRMAAATAMVASKVAAAASSPQAATAASDIDSDADDSFTWTTRNIIVSLTLFVLAGIAEIGGGWLVWKAVRGHGSSSRKAQPPWWWAVVGSFVLVLYGFLPTLQPTDSFGRLYAVYGGFFIVLSFLAGWLLDGDRPDLGDVVGGTISLAGVLIILFWPR